jgi:hypothetical protein
MRFTTRIIVVALTLVNVRERAQLLPPIRPLGPVVAKAGETFGTIVGVRATSGGVLVNEVSARRVVLLDTTRSKVVVVADSTSATANACSGRLGGLIPFKGDSTLFVDVTSMSMLVIDPAGKVARVMSVPSAQDAMAFAGGPLGSASFDPAGRKGGRSSGSAAAGQ